MESAAGIIADVQRNYENYYTFICALERTEFNNSPVLHSSARMSETDNVRHNTMCCTHWRTCARDVEQSLRVG